MANYFRGSTTKNALGYACGEKMVFELELVHGGAGEHPAAGAGEQREDNEWPLNFH